MKSELEKLCEANGIKIKAEYGKNRAPCTWDQSAHPFRVTLTYGRRKLSSDFFQGSACRSDPTAADVLYCLIGNILSGEQTFEEFCSDVGYDTDSRKAHETWERCAEMAPKVRKFLGKDFDLFANAEH